MFFGPILLQQGKTSNEIFAVEMNQLKQAIWHVEDTQNILVDNIKVAMQSLPLSHGTPEKIAREVVFKEPVSTSNEGS